MLEVAGNIKKNAGGERVNISPPKKSKNLSSFTSCSKPVWAFFLCGTQKKIFFLKDGNHAIDGSHWIAQSMATVNCLVTHILQNIFFGVPQKKENTGLEQLESE